MSDQGAEGGEPNRPRHPNSLQGLLRFAVEATRAEDAPAAAPNMAPMDPERRRFLEEALNSMTVNVVQQLEIAAKVLTNAEATEDEQQQALECLLDYVDNIDTANDFCKIGGLHIILPLLGATNPYASIKSESASLIAELAQNNPFCQAQLLELDALSKLLPLLTVDDICVNAIRAVSSLVRNYEPLAAAFIDMGGLECLLGCLLCNNEKLRVQSTRLLSSMCTEFPEVIKELVELHAVEQIANHIEPRGNYDVQLEASLTLLNILTEDNLLATCRSRVDGLNLRSKLAEILRQCGDKPECLEINEFSQILLQRLFNETKSNSAGNLKTNLLDDDHAER